jgi:hypothetical protein
MPPKGKKVPVISTKVASLKLAKGPPPKKAAKSKSTAAPVKSKSLESVDEVADKRIRLERRDVDDQVERVKATKLGQFDDIFINSMVGKESRKTPRELIADEVRELKGAGRQFSTSCWRRFFAEFPMLGNKFGDLSSADDGPAQVNYKYADEMLEALAHPHAKNPKDRTHQPFVSFLAVFGPCALPDLKFTISASKPGPVITLSRSNAMLLAILRYIGLHRLDLTFPAFWPKHRDQFDGLMAEYITSKILTGAERPYFLVGHQHALRVIIDAEAASNVAAAVADDKQVDARDVQRVLRSLSGSVLFKDESVVIQQKSFHDLVQRGLKNL